MNILFLTLQDFKSLGERNIYTDLLREFVKHRHKLFVISPVERRKHQNTHLIEDGDTVILKLKIGNTQKTNIIEKGISTLLIEPTFIKGIRRYFGNTKFDLVIYSTPPITFCKAVRYVKNRDGAKSYLLLKDIFPQNAVDLGMIKKVGMKGIIYRFFRKKEKKLYAVSDHIGCMSQANVDYILQNNPEVNPNIVEVCPNSVEPVDMRIGQEKRDELRRKYDIPLDRKVFVYGGNLGKPQGIPFLIECLKAERDRDEVYFLIVGDGTEYGELKKFSDETSPQNMKLMKRLPKEDYDKMIAACDVGMIFLDYRFTIPNFPSRLLSYMQAGLPVLACTDPNTDIGKIIVEGGFGWWCGSDDVAVFKEKINEILHSDIVALSNNGYNYLLQKYTVERAYDIVLGVSASSL